MKIKMLLLAALATLFAACGTKADNAQTDTNAQTPDTPEAIVCYFSATGTTEAQAKRLASLMGYDIYQIQPEVPYTDDDLNWRDENSRSSVEMRDPASRPALVKNYPDFSKYKAIFIGYPNWWNTAPRVINTFIEDNDLAGKLLIPFMTSGGSDIENSESDLRATYPSLTFAPGLLMNDLPDTDILTWATKVTQ